MHLNLRSLQGASEHVEQQHESASFPEGEGDGFRVSAPVRLVFDVDRQESGRYRLSGQLAGEIELQCSRCLEPFVFPVETEFDLRYVPRAENAGDDEKEVDEDDLATAFYADDQIDLAHLIMEQFQLAVPMKPLCDAACKGLCPQCGTNLNTASCGCARTWDDPRLAALKNLKT